MSRPYSFLLDDLSEYLGLEKREVAKRLKTSSQDIAIDFLKQDPKTLGELEKWYSSTPFYVYDLTNFTAERILQGKIDAVVSICKGRVLDFGCGIAEVAIRCARRGLDVTVWEFEGKTLDYARWRFKKHKVDVKVKVVGESLEVGGYDTVVCLDVLEHVPEPLYLVDLLGALLREDGVLILTTFFQQGFFLPMHLKENEKLNECFPREMERRGWELVNGVYDPFSDYVHVWRLVK